MTITAEQVINALEKALKATWADLQFAERITLDAQDLLEQYRSQSVPKYHLLQKHVKVYEVDGIESVVADNSGHIISHTRQMVRSLPGDDGWWDNYKTCHTDDLGDGWIPVGGAKTLDEVIEWMEGL